MTTPCNRLQRIEEHITYFTGFCRRQLDAAVLECPSFMAEAGTYYLKPFILLACHSPFSAGAELQRSPVLQPCPDRLPEDRGSTKPPPAQRGSVLTGVPQGVSAFLGGNKTERLVFSGPLLVPCMQNVPRIWPPINQVSKPPLKRIKEGTRKLFIFILDHH